MAAISRQKSKVTQHKSKRQYFAFQTRLNLALVQFRFVLNSLPLIAVFLSRLLTMVTLLSSMLDVHACSEITHITDVTNCPYMIGERTYTPSHIPPGQIPPGQIPPVKYHPVKYPQCKLPPGQIPPGQLPLCQIPPGQIPPIQIPPSCIPPGEIPPSHIPPGQKPSSQIPLRTYSPINIYPSTPSACHLGFP